jgi:hypothetical protein
MTTTKGLEEKLKRGRKFLGEHKKVVVTSRVEYKILLEIKERYGSFQKFMDRKVEEERVRKKRTEGSIGWA